MKKYILLFVPVLSVHLLNAQDTIVKTATQETIICTVSTVTLAKIFYTENGVDKVLLKDEVSYFTNHGAEKKQPETEKETDNGSDKIKFKVVLSNDFDLKRSYLFSIYRVVDARPDKKKPIGSVLGFSFKPQNVGNDSLSESMNLFFKKSSDRFDTTSKIVMVLNQLSLRYIGGYSMGSGKIQDLQMTVSIDYYIVHGVNCQLIYEQHRQYQRSVKFIAKASKAINTTYFETIQSALNDFASQLESGEISDLGTVSLDSLLAK